ncbi:MAG TPA: hypothetical protein VJ672_14920 [Gemmatimonadaceae bacterium]|nr:hypothetical protein [Gemmatimonadaceae bacterium]
MRCSGSVLLRRSLGALLLCALAPAAARGQESLFERLGLDRLRLTSIGLGYGPVRPSKVESTHSFALQVDYGEIAPRWHVVFGASYWESHFKESVVRGFEEQLERTIIDPSDDDIIDIGRVRVSDVALEMEVRYVPTRPNSFFKPYVGFGLGAHAIDAESPFIQGTFVESALDNISTGLSGVVGVDLVAGQRFSAGVQGRYTLLSTLRYAAVRGLVSYHFRRARRSSRSP